MIFEQRMINLMSTGVVQIDENSNSSLGTFYFVDKIEPLWERKILENDQNYPAWSLDNAISVLVAKEEPGLYLFSLFDKQTRLENCLFLFHLCASVVGSCSQPSLKNEKSRTPDYPDFNNLSGQNFIFEWIWSEVIWHGPQTCST